MACKHRLQQLRELTSHKPDLSLVKEYILNGWTRQNSQPPPYLKYFVHVKSFLSIAEGIITYGDRIPIPPTLRKEMLERLHESYQGISKTLQMAASCLWWPGILKDIKNIISNCLTRGQNRPNQIGETLKPSSLPDRPWQSVSADLREFKGKHFLIVIDHFSCWIEIKTLATESSATVINKLEDIITHHVIFEEFLSDNGPQFVSKEFQDFVGKYEFQHITSSSKWRSRISHKNFKENPSSA